MSMVDEVIKITKAVYRVLDFLPENDPLKNKAKERALAILENCSKVSPAPGEVLDDIEILLNYLAIGKYQGWVSGANFLIFEKEYRQIKKSIPVPQGSMKRGLQILHRLPEPSPKIIGTEKEITNEPRHIGVLVAKTGSGESELSGKAQVRQGKILQMLERQEKAQVSDFIKELPDITKRTIRRDLDDLLKKGRVVRVGAWNQVFYQITK